MSESRDLRFGQVVFDIKQGEYVTFRRWREDERVAWVFNPRCGECYYTKIRQLTKRERDGRGK